MFALGIPNRQYRRCTSVLGHESSKPIDYKAEKQDDGFYLFSFPNADEYEFRDIVKLLKGNGVTTIGADSQLTEKKIMSTIKLIDLYNLKEGKMGDNSYKTRTSVVTAPGKTEDKEIYIDNTDTLNDVTIRWRGANHWGNKTLTKLKFEPEFEGDDDLMAISNDRKWLFIVDRDEETGEVDWDTLIIDSRELEQDDGSYAVDPEDLSDDDGEALAAAQDDIGTMEEGMMCELCGEIHEGTCGYGKDGKTGRKPAGPNMLQERLQQLAGIKPLI